MVLNELSPNVFEDLHSIANGQGLWEFKSKLPGSQTLTILTLEGYILYEPPTVRFIVEMVAKKTSNHFIKVLEDPDLFCYVRVIHSFLKERKILSCCYCCYKKLKFYIHDCLFHAIALTQTEHLPKNFLNGV